MIEFEEQNLIYDWNLAGDFVSYNPHIELVDETLRDGLQSPSVTHPTLEEKIELLYLMVELGITGVDIGLPSISHKHANEVYLLAKEIADNRLPLNPYCAARTLIEDIRPIVEVSQRVGIAVECAAFIGSSPIRCYTEDWNQDLLLAHTKEAISFAVACGIPCMFVTEDTTRTDPKILRRLYLTAIELGAQRICLSDTVGHIIPEGVYNLVHFVKSVVKEAETPVGLDWHGHNDRGLSIPNSLAAIAAGIDRVHGCALGIGERCGNTALDVLLVNLKLMGIYCHDLRALPAYVNLVSRACQVTVPYNYPVLGADAFRTSSGIHAAAICKAQEKGYEWLANRVYSGIPAELFGLQQIIEIGPMSGSANVRYWLQQRGIDPTEERVNMILAAAKNARKILTEQEIMIAGNVS